MPKDCRTSNSINQKKHGTVVIFNYLKFNEASERTGSEKDVTKIESVFKDLNYEIKIFLDKTAIETRKILEMLSKHDFTNDEILICFIMSHGDDNGIICSSDFHLNKNEFINSFKNNKTLKDKPKVFFIQACRGYTKMDFFKVDENRVKPKDADIFVAYATTNEHKAYRDSLSGSPFIQYICDSIPKSTNLNICELLTYVNKLIVNENDKDFVQCLEFTSTLTSDLYLVPKFKETCSSKSHKISLEKYSINSSNIIHRFPSSSGISVTAMVGLNNGDLAVGYGNGNIKILDVITGKLKYDFSAHKETVSSLVVFKNGNFGSASFEEIKIWDLNTREIKYQSNYYTTKIWTLLSLPNDDLASIDCDGAITIWDVNNKRIKEQLKRQIHEQKIFSTTVLENDYFASGLFDGSIKIWNFNTGEVKQTLQAYKYCVTSLTSRNNSYLASKSDNTVKIWSLKSGNLEEQLEIQENELSAITELAITADGHFASGYKDGSIIIRNLLKDF